MDRMVFVVIPFIIFYLLMAAAVVTLVVLAIRALLKYLRTDNSGPDAARVRKSLGEALKEHRGRCGLTQEYVAEALGVSRQAVSKWENGASEPNMSNLLALAKLYGVTLEELLQDVQ